MHAELTIREGGTGRFTIRPGQTFVLGRSGKVSITLKDAEVSRRHATLELRQDGLFVTDLNSSNGSWLGPRQLDPQTATLAPHGSALRFGGHVLEVALHEFDPELMTQTRQDANADTALLGGEYELQELLGRGAAGRVWAARHKVLDHQVAIKVFHGQGEGLPNNRERFLREGRLCMQVKSPQVVEVFDVRILDQVPVIIMELVHGPPVIDLVEKGPLPLGDAIRIGLDVARALASATAIGVVHRDVKPHNILISPGGQAKLTDFGLAKELGANALTADGTGMGTLPYAAPEQISDAVTSDPSTDVYGLGATLYHLIAGRPPFDLREEGIMMTIQRIETQAPAPLQEPRPDCPEGLADLIHQMLKKNPAKRPDTNTVVAALEALLGQVWPEGLKRDEEDDEPRTNRWSR